MVTTRRNSDDDVPNFEAMISAAVANALPNLTAALRTQITNDIKNGAESSGGSGGDVVPQGIHVWIERFTKLKSLAFWSAATPAEAEDWITYMEKLFQVLGCPNNFKTLLAAFKLEGIFWHTNVAQVAAAARNIELLHESGNSNKRDRDGVVRTRVLSIEVIRIGVMIRNDRIFGVRIGGLLVGMGMTARVRVRGGLLRLCLLHFFVLPVESLIRVFVIRLLGDVLLAASCERADISKTDFRTRYGLALRVLEEHERHLRIVMEILRTEEVVSKFSKCEFCYSNAFPWSILYLLDGINMDLIKVEASPNGREPTTVRRWRKFYLGLCWLLPTFVEGYCQLALTSYPDDEKGFLVVSDIHDATKKVWVVFLMHKGNLETTIQRLDVELLYRVLGGYWASMRIESKPHATDQRSLKGTTVNCGYCANVDDCTSQKVMTKAHSFSISSSRYQPKCQDLKTVLLVNWHEARCANVVSRMYDFSAGFQKALGNSLKFNKHFILKPRVIREDHTDFEDMLRLVLGMDGLNICA
ncbi:hypothetical protein Tco_1054217 [Tanacetum coccineum]|uniref:Zinc finger, CCHC-type, retrotransposon Gag domain protein n=1 Tax=Tanacetum coccineum TaxID=301880 RepID=A0ABQ5GXM7_9ASTR